MDIAHEDVSVSKFTVKSLKFNTASQFNEDGNKENNESELNSPAKRLINGDSVKKSLNNNLDILDDRPDKDDKNKNKLSINYKVKLSYLIHFLRIWKEIN